VSITESYTERLSKELREITKPLMDQLRDIDGEIEDMASELTALRAHRTKLVAIARSIDPELVPKKVVAKPVATPAISDEKVEAMYEWLKTNVNGDEFYASGIVARDDAPFSQSQVSKALTVLHERGQIRLVRQGSGGSKHFRMVA
jgi:hypothetical protein